jgi:hypothetical protein
MNAGHKINERFLGRLRGLRGLRRLRYLKALGAYFSRGAYATVAINVSP